MSLIQAIMPRSSNDGMSARIRRWLARCIVGAWVRIISLLSSAYPWMTSLDFSYGVAVALFLTSLTILDLKMRPVWCFCSSSLMNLNTPRAMRLSISRSVDSSNRAPGVVILPSARSWAASVASACSLLERNASDMSVSWAKT